MATKNEIDNGLAFLVLTYNDGSFQVLSDELADEIDLEMYDHLWLTASELVEYKKDHQEI